MSQPARHSATRAFLRAFWCCAGAALLGGVLLMRAGEGSARKGLPARPPFPHGGSFVGYYPPSGVPAHDIFLFGLFGTGDRLRQSDIIAMGSSHVLYGLRAATLTDGLREAGRPLRAYNLGCGLSEGIRFELEALRRNRVRDKRVVVDLFDASNISDYAREALRSSRLQAYARVYNAWTAFARDWVLDPWLPSLRYDGGKFAVERFLQTCDIRDFATGDVRELWAPRIGEVYPRSDVPRAYDPRSDTYGRYGRIEGLIAFPDEAKALFRQSGLRPVFTLIPFGGYAQGRLPDLHPYVPISPEGLFFYDDQRHVTGAGAALVTSRLREGLRTAFDSAAAAPPPQP